MSFDASEAAARSEECVISRNRTLAPIWTEKQTEDPTIQTTNSPTPWLVPNKPHANPPGARPRASSSRPRPRASPPRPPVTHSRPCAASSMTSRKAREGYRSGSGTYESPTGDAPHAAPNAALVPRMWYLAPCFNTCTNGRHNTPCTTHLKQVRAYSYGSLQVNVVPGGTYCLMAGASRFYFFIFG